MNRISKKQLLLVALAVSLGWGLRGQHGHERGAAVAGAMAGLSLAAVTGSPRWMGAAVLGSLGFAIGGSLSYGRFVQPAYQGSWEAILTLAQAGLAWGGLGSLGLGLGLNLSRYRVWERVAMAGSLFMVWVVVDHLIWGHLSGPQDLETRRHMIWVLLAAWVFLSLYVGVLRKDRTSLRLALAGGAGFGVGFPLAAWAQGTSSRFGIPLDGWMLGQHLIGLCGGASLAWVALHQESSWTKPVSVPPWERWLAVAWLIVFLPSWQIANNLDFWISEQALLPVWMNRVVWSGLFLFLLALAFWGWYEIRRGRIFVTSWMPRHLRRLFLAFLWITTLVACSKLYLIGFWSPTPLGFLFLASAITLLIRVGRPLSF